MRKLSSVFFRCFSFLLLFLFLVPTFSPAFAQISQPFPQQSQSFTRPNVDNDVPLNQHTYVQSMFLEILIAIQCQLTGIDLADLSHSCLGLNMQTGKLGYAPEELYQNGMPPVGGVLGMLNGGISGMFVPVAGSHDYVRYVAGNFGVVKSAIAAPATGFEGLSPIISLWKATRDIAYFVLIVAFIFIGIGVMLRLRIDPRTVMTVQNQIPRVIICIILITFSYAIAGLMIDVMWSVTYMGINKIAEADNNTTIIDCPNNKQPVKLDAMATQRVLQTPFAYVNGIFLESSCVIGSGVLNLSGEVGHSIAAIELDLLLELLGARNGCDWDAGDTAVSAGVGLATGAGVGFLVFGPIGGAIGGLVGGLIGAFAGGAENAGLCLLVQGFNYLLGWTVVVMWFVIVLIILIITLFRIWFELLKAYALTIVYVILGPLWIVMGLLPKKPLGFEKWMRVMFANLAIFPATVFMIVGARVLSDLFNGHTDKVFVPPLVGNPDAGHLGAIVSFAMLLLTPSVLTVLREKLGVQQNKAFGAAIQTFNTGRQAAGVPAKQAWKHLNQRDQYGNAMGPISGLTDRFTTRLGRATQNVPLVGDTFARKQFAKGNFGSTRGFDDWNKAYKAERKDARSRGSAALKDFDAKYGDVNTYIEKNDPGRRGNLPPFLAAQQGGPGQQGAGQGAGAGGGQGQGGPAASQSGGAAPSATRQAPAGTAGGPQATHGGGGGGGGGDGEGDDENKKVAEIKSLTIGSVGHIQLPEEKTGRQVLSEATSGTVAPPDPGTTRWADRPVSEHTAADTAEMQAYFDSHVTQTVVVNPSILQRLGPAEWHGGQSGSPQSVVVERHIPAAESESGAQLPKKVSIRMPGGESQDVPLDEVSFPSET